MLGQIAERDAVSNVKMGIQRSLMRNQDLFELFRNTHNRLLNSYIMAAQTAYKDGKKGSYIMGPKSYTFVVLGEKFSYSDFAITINYSSKDELKVQRLQEIAKEFAVNNVLDPVTLTEAVMSESASEIKKLIRKGYESFEEKNNVAQQAQQQVEEISKNLQQMEQQLKEAQSEVQKFQKQDLDLKQQEISIKDKIAEYTKLIKEMENDTTAKHNDKQDDLKEATVQLEREHLYLETGPAKEVKNL